MRRLGVVLFSFIFIFLSVGCNTEKVEEVENNSVDLIEIQEDEKDDVADKKSEDPLHNAYQGIMDGIEISIGEDANQLFQLYGEPVGSDSFLGGYYIGYTDMVFFATYNFEDDEKPYGDVVTIAYMGQDQVYGIKIGMNADEVRSVLGEPDEIYQDVEGSELYEDSLVWEYATGEYMVTVTFDAKGKVVEGIYLARKK